MIKHLISSEPYLINLKIEEELKKLNIAKKDLNYLEPKSIDELNNFSETYSLFNDNKIAIIKNIEDENLIKVLENSLDNVNIFLVSPIDKRKKLYKWLSKNKYIEDIPVYNKSKLLEWIQELGYKNNCKISNNAANEIIKLTGENDMYNIEQEVYKLICMNEKITSELVKKVVTKSSILVSFDLTDAILKKNISKSLTILNYLISKNESMIPIIALLNKNFSVIRSLKEVDDTTLKQSGIDYFTLKNLRPYAKDNILYDDKKLEKYINLTEKADFYLKNGLEEKLILEQLIISISMKGEF